MSDPVHVIFFPLKGLQISSSTSQISSQEYETPVCDWVQVIRL